MGRRWLLPAWAAALCWASVAGAAATDSAGRWPHVVLITADTFRPDHLGYLGHPGEPTPALDAFCREGVVFREAYTTSGWTSPGLISLLSGLDALSHGVDIRGKSLDPAAPTLPDALRAASYYAPDILFLTDIPNFANLGLQPYARREELLHRGDQILFACLQEVAASGRPTLVYYHYRDLHLPYDAGEPYESAALPAAFATWVPFGAAARRLLAAEKMELVRTQIHLVRGIIDFRASDRPWVAALYEAQVRRMDAELFAPLRAALSQPGLAGNTLLVIAADHGEELLERDLIGHVSTFKEGRLYETLVRIPLVFWYPGTLPAGRVVTEPVQCTDVMPTVLELLGLPLPAGLDGQSLLPLLTGTGEWRVRPLFMETSAAGYTADAEQYVRRYRAVRAGRWKLHQAVTEQRLELYDLAADPGERRDLSDREPLLADSLRSMLERWAQARQERRIAASGSQSGPAAAGLGAAAAAGATAGATPRIEFPGPGDTLEYLGDEHRIELRWTGPPRGRYIIDYEVGAGSYRLAGEFAVDSATPSFGPLPEAVWNSLALYNPFRFRVFPADHRQAASDWVSFYLRPTARAGWSGGGPASWGLRAGVLARAAWRHGANLVVGSGRGLRDLFLLAATWSPADVTAWVLLAVVAGAVAWPQALRLGQARCRAWGLVVVYVTLVYSTIPVVPTVWRAMAAYTDGSIRFLGVLLVGAGGVLVGLRAVRRVRRHRLAVFAALAAVGTAYAALLRQYAPFPAERLHLLEYGLMSWILLRALRLDTGPRAAYAWSLAATVFIGFGDECIQWVLPQRVFELKDVQLNAVSGALGLAVVRLVEGPPGQVSAQA